VVNELFDKFNALEPDIVPYLAYFPSEVKDNKPTSGKRKGLSPSAWDKMNDDEKNHWVVDKIRKISSYYSNKEDVRNDKDLVEQYKLFINSQYTYSNLD